MVAPVHLCVLVPLPCSVVQGGAVLVMQLYVATGVALLIAFALLVALLIAIPDGGEEGACLHDTEVCRKLFLYCHVAQHRDTCISQCTYLFFIEPG